jgi:hypothetical protein
VLLIFFLVNCLYAHANWLVLRLKRIYGLGAPVSSLVTERVEKPAQEEYIPFLETEKEEPTLSIVGVGASGDLARRKIFPALFALFTEDRLPEVQFYDAFLNLLQDMPHL